MSSSLHPERAESRFLDMVRRGGPLNYATRCRIVGDEVGHQDHAGDPLGARARLDEHLAALAVVPGTMAELLARAAGVDHPAGLSMAELRGGPSGASGRPTPPPGAPVRTASRCGSC